MAGAAFAGPCVACGRSASATIDRNPSAIVTWTPIPNPLRDTLEMIVTLSPCSISYGQRPKGWTCLDHERAASDPEGKIKPEYAKRIARGGEICQYCLIRRTALLALGAGAR